MNAPLRMAVGAVRLADLRDPQDERRIEGFLADHPDATPFHRPAWLLAVAQGTGNQPLALVLECSGALIGYLPLTLVTSPIFGRVLASTGFAVGGGLLMEEGADPAPLFAALEDLATKHKAPSAELRGGLLPESRQGWAVKNQSHAGFIRPLAASDEAELTAIPRKQRAEVRKGLANDFEVVTGGKALSAEHYQIYATSVRNLGTPVFPRALFRAVLQRFGQDADILTVRHQDKAVASVLSLYHRGAVMPYWGGGTWEARSLRANDRMYYELMRHARLRGCTHFDFGRSKTGSGAYDFKRNWGFEPAPLSYGVYTAPGATPRDADPTSATHSRRIELWKKLPLPVANLIGPWIARGLG
ncbi:FemAB family XrtA/PEP-CTERM system-associated protein [Novosphingobium rosa]|uniref:FemAB family XrtA/PEP-CTERM system-associated protein n=1 Tax=Novosphingobium rosa TaxID=76978 RepID=UPI00082A6C91|nr:FemAB family XrtA/PEP-CTERM system-associated protein [Novosphingobium rosa]